MNRTRELFNEWASDGDDKRAEKEHSYAAKKVLDSLKWKSSDSYLDIGCGNGYTLRHVAGYVKKGRLIGLDFSDEMIKKARLLSKTIPNASFYLTDFMKWRTSGHKFDKIFSMETFYYFRNVPKALRKTFALLKKKGIFACVVDFYKENEASHVWPDKDHCNVPMQLYSMDEWRDMFAKAGFKKIGQYRIKYPKKFAKESWQARMGSLVTTGLRS